MKIKIRKILENSILPLIVGIFNLFFFQDPAFFSISCLPYVLVPLFSGVIYGVFYGYYALILEIALIVGPLPWIAGLLHDGSFSIQTWYVGIGPLIFIYIPIEILLIFLFSISFTRTEKSKFEIKERFSSIAKENLQLKNLSNAQAEVSQELEERVYRQKEAITSLYAQIQKMYTLDLEEAFEVLLETIQLFTRADQLSIYKISESKRSLHHVKSLEEKNIQQVLPLKDTLEGWVLRNNRIFSIRMVLEYEHLNRLDQGRSILIYPINVNRKPWGILNVEAMPFVKYNEYTEQLLEIIIHLAETALSRAIDYQSLTGVQTLHPVSGLPIYTHFLQVFDEELIRVHLGKSSFSYIILEVLNYGNMKDAQPILTKLVEALKEIIRGKGEPFHYKNESQLGIILPSIDLDGVSLLCLDLLEQANRISIIHDGKELNIEAVVGFAHSEKEDTRETLMARAERLLDLQKEMAV